MSFFIRLDNKVREKIVSWNLPPRFINEIFEHLYEELAERPHEKLDVIPGQEDPLLYSFDLLAEGDPPRDYVFEFSVRYHSDEVTLIIRDCDDYLSVETGSG